MKFFKLLLLILFLFPLPSQAVGIRLVHRLLIYYLQTFLKKVLV